MTICVFVALSFFKDEAVRLIISEGLFPFFLAPEEMGGELEDQETSLDYVLFGLVRDV